MAIVFGSLARGEARRDSDVDVAVQLPTPLDADRKMQLTADIAAMTGRPVDLVDLRTVGEPLLGQILKHGRRIRGEAADLVPLIRHRRPPRTVNPQPPRTTVIHGTQPARAWYKT